ncbi:hypothetical protein EXIGLDRAFT_834246 [Exidia glandulosa HHB12029]|uniref:Uncharacterized protein n=1 Tax=Exidia glandulosa HHB12029 TaxID=1314781 RepID=A0A165JYC7_EXIGL|nr:hypothetical protein EXIGLDRAFT_834246 [Exidia glandulosa HHB12029]
MPLCGPLLPISAPPTIPLAMAVVARRQPSGVIATGLSVATVTLNVAGAAADAVPIAKQILNSAAHISAVAEKIQKKREAMYTLVEKADIYATQIDIAVAGRILDASLQRRLERLYSVFLKIEALVDVTAGGKSNALARVWHNVVTKPNRAETLVVKLDQEIQLFEARSYPLLTGIHLSLVVDKTACIADATARAVAADMRYDGQFRVLRDCDIRKGNIIERCETDEGTVVWASARVDGQLMVIRYLDPSSDAKRNDGVVAEVAQWRRTPYHEYLENVKKVSTIVGSHPHVVQLYGRHIQGPAAVFRSGTCPLGDYVRNMIATKGDVEHSAERIRLAYKILDASFHLTDIHRLTWIGREVLVDEYGEPHIGLFDDIGRTDSEQRLVQSLDVCSKWIDETGVVDQVHNSHLQSTITQQLRDGNDTDSLQQVWDIIRQEQLLVRYNESVFPIISGNLSLSHEMIARARRCFQMWAPGPTVNFLQGVLLGDATTAFRVRVDFWRYGDRDCLGAVDICTYEDRHLRHEYFAITLPAGCPLSAKIAWAAGVPGDFGAWDGSLVTIYQTDGRGDYSEYDTESGGSEDEYSNDDGEALEEEHGVDDVEECDDSEKEGEDYETAQGV